MPDCRQGRQRTSAASMAGGPDRDRTGDLLNAIQARSQLRYRPTSRARDIHASTKEKRGVQPARAALAAFFRNISGPPEGGDYVRSLVRLKADTTYDHQPR